MTESFGLKGTNSGIILVLFILLVLTTRIFTRSQSAEQDLGIAANGLVSSNATDGYTIYNRTEYTFRLLGIAGNIGLPTLRGSSEPYTVMVAYSVSNNRFNQNHYELVLTGPSPRGFASYEILSNGYPQGKFSFTMSDRNFHDIQSSVAIRTRIVGGQSLYIEL
ncbi:hypothetical protein [Paenibacillus herberti]|uniref:Uncharacterized protein n=1 Tax=Paenibacillus herberti TaxID=1619309 RepID=A0A229NUM3_9BACL|nr:hypothetical protein [Paenibacillus herberti]OXM13568.1 hypothetical protein CGZ75_21275 [Paenibacillus herberti]